MLLTDSTTQQDFNSLIADLKQNNTPPIQSLALEAVNFFVFTVNVDDCGARNLWENPVVSSVSINAMGSIDMDAEQDTSTSRRDIGLNSSSEAAMFDLHKRQQQGLVLAQGLTGDKDDSPDPYHLGWLTSPWAQIGLAGQQGTCKCNFRDRSAVLLIGQRPRLSAVSVRSKRSEQSTESGT